MAARKEKLPKNVSAFVDRHGKRRYRWRKGGRTIYLVEHPNTAAGSAELARIIAGIAAPKLDRHAHGTMAWAATRYFASTTFTGAKSESTQRTSRLILEKFIAEVGDDKIDNWRFDHIEAFLAKAAVKRKNDKGRMIGGPSAAMNLRGELLPFFDYAFKLLGITKQNPVAQAAPIAVPKGGFHTWTEAEIAQYRKRWNLGTNARLALEIFLWTAQRRGDASRFGRKHLVDAQIELTPAKTRNSSGKTLALTASPQLLEAIAAMAVTGTETFLVNEYGKPFSRAGLGNKMREWCDAAGLPHCTAHGLRKATTRRAAEAGASNQELKAVGGWTTDSQVAIYTAAVEQKRMAEQAMAPVIAFDKASREEQ